MKKMRFILIAVLLAAATGYSTTWINEDYEAYTLGTIPICSNYAPTSTQHLAESHLWVIGSPTNRAGTGQGVEFFDNNTNGVRLEYDMVSTNEGVGAIRFDFSFSPLQAVGSGSFYIAAGVAITNGNTGSSAQRFCSVRLYDNATLRFIGGGNAQIGSTVTGLATGSLHKVSAYVNDTDAAVTYTDPNNAAATNVLGADTVVFWMDGTNMASGTMMTIISVGTNGLGRVGFASVTTYTKLYYALDDVKVSGMHPDVVLRTLTVTGGEGGGAYESGTSVTITAATNNELKTFLGWIGDTNVLSSNTVSTTFTMPDTNVALTATYDKSILTVTGGTGSGAYTSGAQVAISAAAPATSFHKFYKWVGDTDYVDNPDSADATVTVPENQDILLTATYSGFFYDFEGETVGGSPGIDYPMFPTQYPYSNCVFVISSASNTAATGKAIEYVDSTSSGQGLEYNVTETSDGLSAARASLAFSWKNLGETATSNQLAASFAAFNSIRSMSAGASRWTEVRLQGNGTIDVASTGSSAAEDSAVQLTENAANTINIFANDHQDQSVDYTVNGTTYTLPTNSVAYWLNGQLMTFNGGSQYVGMDLDGTVSSTSNNLGKFGFVSGSGAIGIDYTIDDLGAGEIPAGSLYSLSVTSGGSGGLYASGQQVAIKAYTNASKNFVAWSGDTGVLSSNTESTTVTMPAAGVSLTATYDVNVLTVVNGTTSGPYTTGTVVNLVADPAPANQVFVKWIGDIESVDNIYAATTTVIMPAQDITVTAQYAGLLDGFENDTIGQAPTNGSPLASVGVLVVDAVANTAGTGQAIEFLDDDAVVSMGIEYNFVNGAPGISAAKASFAFSWKDLGNTNGEPIAVGFGEYNSSSSRQLSAGARRWTEARLVNDGTVDFAASYVEGSVTNSFSSNNHPITALKKNTLTLFVNDYDAAAVNYTVNGVTSSLPANSVAYWLNGVVVMFGANPYAPMDLSDVNLASQTIGASEGNLGKFGFASTTAATGLDYILDDIAVSADPWASLYALVVTGGDNGGLYTNGQQVAISVSSTSRTFKAWSGDTLGAVADTNSASTTVTMPSAGVTLTAIYQDVILTVSGNATGSGTYTNGQQVAIAAADIRSGVAFREWTGDTQCVDNVTSANATVTVPEQDIALTATYDYDLTVTSGTGDGSYTNHAQVAIAADAPALGKAFDQWTGDTQYVDNVTAANATVTMSTNPVSLTATYADAYYNLAVVYGSGDGSYTNGTQVEIVADAPADTNQVFDVWIGDTGVVDNVNSQTATVTIAYANVNVEATYKDIVRYTTNGPIRVPLTWMESYGLTPPDAQVVLDQDGDGMTAGQEYIAGTDPTNAVSILKSAQVVRNTVTWSPVVTDRVYSVYWSTNLKQGFTMLADNLVSPQGSYTNATPNSIFNNYQIRVRLLNPVLFP